MEISGRGIARCASATSPRVRATPCQQRSRPASPGIAAHVLGLFVRIRSVSDRNQFACRKRRYDLLLNNADAWTSQVLLARLKRQIGAWSRVATGDMSRHIGMSFNSNWLQRYKISARKWVATGIGAVFLSAATLIYAADEGVSAHPAVADCGACHMPGQDLDQTHAQKLAASQEMLCARCHARTLEIGHPSGFAPRRPLPAEYPLDGKGEMTCSTCHLPHGRTPGLLRGTRKARELCQACHEPAFFARMKDAGTSLVASGHLETGVSTVDIDRHSLYCLGCHGGNLSGDAAVSVGSTGILHHTGSFAPHPIGRSYDNAIKNGSFRPENQLASKNVKLSDGKISCVS